MSWLRGSVSWCGVCGHVGRETGSCPRCGSPLGKAVRGGVVEVPAGAIPCSRCGTRDVPIVLRGWSRVFAYFVGARETRSSAYVCADCATKQTIVNLVVTAILGWWSLQSFFWYAPRATYFNWRSVWAPPGNPLAWGASPLAELLENIAAEQEEPYEEAPPPEGEPGVDDSPLAHLSAAERHLVLNARDLYGVLGIGVHADAAEVKAAWRDRAKANHPDLNPGDADAENRMLAINQAYEILGNPRLRAAYDWSIASGSRA